MKKSVLSGSFAVLLCVSLAVGLFSSCGKKETIEPDASTTAGTTVAAVASDINPLTGLSGLSADAQGARPIAVMVENSPDARPQWGLCSPDIVIEGLVEGGITRMMWLYADAASAPKIGPTRSARHDYVELAEGFDAIYVHFGGSVYAYNAIKADGVNDIDGINDGGFARDSSRKVATEHTAYTTGANIVSVIASKGYRTAVNTTAARPFNFASSKRSLAGGACNSVLAVFSESYKHTFKYNSSDGLYYNYMNSSEMKDADGKTMAVSNVIILYTDVSAVEGSTKGHVDWNLTSGTGVYVSNGTYENITWSKGNSTTATNPLVLKDSAGNKLELNTGKAWIGFVPSSNAGSTVIA